MSDSVRLKRLLSESDVRAGVKAEALPLLSVSISWGVRRREAAGTTTRAAAEDLSNYKICRAGDLVINRMRAFQGALGIAPEDGIVSPDYAVLRVDPRIDSRWLNYFLTSGSTVATMASLVRGIGGTEAGNVRTPRLNIADLLSIAAPLVSAEEQRVIADYLDREAARIDTLIEEQQRLIEMLRERQESAIRAVLLRGLDDDAPLRASGSEFLGLIPSAWAMVPTRHLCTITTGDEDSGNASDDGAYPFYVRGREILRSDAYAFDGEAVMTPGDGQGGTGKVFHYFDGKFQAHQRVYVFTDFHGITGRYFYYYLSTFLRPIALAGSNTVTMESLRRPLLAGFPVAVPPADEQTLIVEHLDELTAKINQLIAETERFIELAQERREALITAAVTGQIDVQEVA
ncbi:restriction endonuclease subunit S [Streptomyces sp. NPDC097640]|uniref:restriction endonuclease subunit S n=1 Tax=Streptomyces sp. NPDC097640 TaxID=3157229 RepID=UPI003328EE72